MQHRYANLTTFSVLCAGFFCWFSFAAPLHAYSPSPMANNDLLAEIYPDYPQIDYGSGEEAKQVKRGEYLAKMGNCLACHSNTAQGGEPYAGGLPMHTPFGTFYSPNITLDKETGLGQWSEEDFIVAMKQGIAPDGSKYFPVFPYIYFNLVSDDDLRAMWAFFKKVPTVNAANKKHDVPFPFNVRYGQTFWRILFFRPEAAGFQDDPMQNAEWNRGKYLVEGLGHCAMCHTPANPLGAAKKKYHLTGQFIEGYWAPNITREGLATVSKSTLAEIFVTGESLRKTRPMAGPMVQVNHNSLSHLTEADRLAMAEYLKNVSSEQPNGVANPSDAEPTLKRGKQVYLNSCNLCHQRGETGAPIIGSSANWYKRVQERGVPALYEHTINGYNSMPIKGACVTCSDNDIKSAVDYLLKQSLTRSQWQALNNAQPRNAKLSEAVGQKIYNENCAQCHDNGEFGAQIIGDQATWRPLIAKNMDVLITNTIRGKGQMPEKGGCAHCTNPELIAAVKYIVDKSKSKGDFDLW